MEDYKARYIKMLGLYFRLNQEVSYTIKQLQKAQQTIDEMYISCNDPDQYEEEPPQD